MTIIDITTITCLPEAAIKMKKQSTISSTNVLIQVSRPSHLLPQTAIKTQTTINRLYVPMFVRSAKATTIDPMHMPAKTRPSLL
jgi:hypothetical protein